MAPKNVKKHDSDDSTSDSGPDDRNPPQKKFKTDKGNPKKTTSTSNDEEHSWSLGKNRFLKVRTFHGKLFVDIREFYEKNGELLPGKKGISMSVEQWNKVLSLSDEVQESITKLA